MFGLALCVPVITREPEPLAKEFHNPIQSEGSDQAEIVRKRRTLFGLDIDVYNNNGFGFGKIWKLFWNEL